MTDRQCKRCGEVNPAEIHTCTPKEPEPWGYISHKSWKMPVFVEANDLQAANLPHNNPNYTPVYKAPPKKEWVGLTCGDVVDAEQECKHTVDENGNIHFADNADFAHAIEAKLKAKNA